MKKDNNKEQPQSQEFSAAQFAAIAGLNEFLTQVVCRHYGSTCQFSLVEWNAMCIDEGVYEQTPATIKNILSPVASQS